MPVGGLIAGVASLGSAAIGAYSANKAAKQQAKAAKQAQATELEMYRQSREDLAPYRGVGEQGAYSLADMFGFKTPNNPDGSSPFAEKAWGAFKDTPYYRVPYEEGMHAIDSSAAARGNLMSSGHLKRIGEFAGNYASKQFGSYMDRLYQLAGLGQNSATNTANAALSTGRGVAGSQMAAGEAAASGIVGSTNAITSGIEGVGNNLAYLAMRPTSGYGSNEISGARGMYF